MSTCHTHWIFTFVVIASMCSARAEQTEGQKPIDEKGAFISDAMSQVRKAIAAQARESAKRGEFSSIAPPPTLVPFGDWDYVYLKDGTLKWKPNSGQAFSPVTVPIGFVSDLASIPRAFWSVLPRQGRYAYAAIIHDYLYWVQDRPRDEADQILLIAMSDSKVDHAVIETIYQSVHLGGLPSWNENARLKAAGEKRILKRFPTDFTMSWSEWKKIPGVFSD